MKVQIVADALGRDILYISMGKGSQHDFKMLQESKVCFSPQIQVLRIEVTRVSKKPRQQRYTDKGDERRRVVCPGESL